MKLRRELNLTLLLLYGVGNILGAGIYVLVGKVAYTAGYYAPVAFFVAAIIAGLTGLTYVELSSRYPLSAGEAVYVDEGFNIKTLSIIVGLMVCLSGLISSATLTRGFVGYMQLFVSTPDELIIIALLATLFIIAIIGITESVTIAALFTLLEVGGLIFIIWISKDALGQLPERWDELVPPLESGVWIGIVAGAFLSFFAFIGFEDMVNVAEEVKNVRRTMPIAIVLALIICTILYGAIALVSVLQVNPANLGQTDAPLAYVYEQATGKEPIFIGVLGLFAIVNGILIQLIMVSRILYGMANRHWVPKFLGTINQRFQTPIVATALAGFIILALALSLPLVSLASATSFVVLLIFTLVNAALISIKLKLPIDSRATQVPLFIPITGLLATISLACFSLFLL